MPKQRNARRVAFTTVGRLLIRYKIGATGPSIILWVLEETAIQLDDAIEAHRRARKDHICGPLVVMVYDLVRMPLRPAHLRERGRIQLLPCLMEGVKFGSEQTIIPSS